MTTLPPGPRSSLWTVVQYLRDPLGCLAPLAARYGDPFLVPGKVPMVVTGDPAHVRVIYTADPDTFEPLHQDMRVFLGDRSLILLGGPEHRRLRKLVTPPFAGARMRAYGEGMREIAERRTAGWERGATVSILEVAQQISLDTILCSVFGLREPARMAELASLLLDFANSFSPLVALFPVLRRELGGVGPYAASLRRRQRLDAAFDALIAESRAAGPREDVLSLLLVARDERGEPLSEAEVRDQLLLLVSAGYETTAISIAWALYALHRPENAGALERLLAELAAPGPEVDAETLARLPYLGAVCDETLRRFPAAQVPSPRRLLRPLDLGGYALPEGTGVGVGIGLVHFREDIYPEPHTFRPERFLERSYSPFEFVPFGGGARRCLGGALAVHEMRLVVATLLRRFRLRLASLRPDPGKVRAATVGPAHGVRVVVEEVRR